MEQEEIELNLAQLVQPLRMWWWVILCAGFIGALTAYFVQVRKPLVYSAETTVMVVREPDAYAYDSYYASLADQQLATTYAELLLVEPVLETVSAKLGYAVSSGQISVDSSQESQFIRVSVTDLEPEATAQIANTLVTAFIEYSESLQVRRFEESEQTVNAQIAEIELSLAEVEQELTALLSASMAEQEAHIELLIDEATITVTDLEQSILALETQEMTEAIRSELATKRVDLKLWNSSLNIFQQIYIGLVVRGESQFGDSLQIQINQLDSDQSLYQQLYADLINSRESIRLSKLEATPNIVQIEPALVPLAPIGQRPIWIVGGLLSAISVIGLLYLAQLLDRTVKTPDDVKHLLGISVLGIMPEREDKSAEFELPEVMQQPRSPFAEAVRKIRANLEFTHVDAPLRSLLVTSTMESEGKSTLASNLASALAHNGKRVLLIDGDMRRPTVHKQFGLKRSPGLSNLIGGNTGHSDAVIDSTTKTDLAELDVLTAGDSPPNPAELLGSQRFKDAIEQFTAKYDLVIIDAPPMLIVDPVMTSKAVDGIVYAIRPGTATRDAVKSAFEELQRCPTPVLGVVLTRLDEKTSRYYGYNGYYSNYAYNYQDGNKNDSGRGRWQFGRKRRLRQSKDSGERKLVQPIPHSLD